MAGVYSASSGSTSTLKDTVQDKMDVVSFHISNHIERIQLRSTTFFDEIHDKFAAIYGNSIVWFDNLQIKQSILHAWETASLKGNDLLEGFRHTGIHIHFTHYVNTAKQFLKNEVSKQAIYFGFAGLVTGGVIGLCIGYTVKQGSLSSHYFSSPSNGSATLMKAILCSNSRRGIDGITLSTIPVPRHIGATEVLVQVKAMGIDNIDGRIATGYLHLFRKHLGFASVNEPFVLGRECSGIIVEIGSLVESFEVNDRVYVCIPIWASRGLMSEYVVVSDKYVGHKPRNISFEGAATLPYAALTLWSQIIPKSNLDQHTSKSKRILIHLGALTKNDGVGLLATQLFKSWGGRVTISTMENTSGMLGDDDNNSPSGVAQMTFLHTLKSLGAESHLIIPNDPNLLPDLTQRIYDVIINTDSSRVSGVLANFARDLENDVIETFPPDLTRRSSWSIFYIVGSTYNYLFSKNEETDESCTGILEECRRLVESGFLIPVVARSFLASQYDQAIRHVYNSNHSALAQAHVGKSVVVFKALASP